jgi:hypothetical protein
VDNRVVTATGDSNTPFNGEVNLTFDGSSLSAATFVGNLTGTATTATNISIATTTSSDTTTSIVLVANQSTGNQSPFIDSGLSYDASSNNLNVTGKVFSEAYYGTSPLSSTSFGVKFESTQTKFLGVETLVDSISNISYQVQKQIRNVSAGTFIDIVGFVSWDNNNYNAAYIDLSPYLIADVNYVNYVMMQASGIWVPVADTNSHYVSRICSKSFYYKFSTDAWSESNLDSPFGDESNNGNFPVSSRIVIDLYNTTGGTSGGDTLIPRVRFFRRGPADDTSEDFEGSVYYSFKLSILN